MMDNSVPFSRAEGSLQSFARLTTNRVAHETCASLFSASPASTPRTTSNVMKSRSQNLSPSSQHIESATPGTLTDARFIDAGLQFKSEQLTLSSTDKGTKATVVTEPGFGSLLYPRRPRSAAPSIYASHRPSPHINDFPTQQHSFGPGTATYSRPVSDAPPLQLDTAPEQADTSNTLKGHPRRLTSQDLHMAECDFLLSMRPQRPASAHEFSNHHIDSESPQLHPRLCFSAWGHQPISDNHMPSPHSSSATFHPSRSSSISPFNPHSCSRPAFTLRPTPDMLASGIAPFPADQEMLAQPDIETPSHMVQRSLSPSPAQSWLPQHGIPIMHPTRQAAHAMLPQTRISESISMKQSPRQTEAPVQSNDGASHITSDPESTPVTAMSQPLPVSPRDKASCLFEYPSTPKHISMLPIDSAGAPRAAFSGSQNQQNDNTVQCTDPEAEHTPDLSPSPVALTVSEAPTDSEKPPRRKRMTGLTQDQRRERRRKSNRESARRSRVRKLEETHESETQIAELQRSVHAQHKMLSVANEHLETMKVCLSQQESRVGTLCGGIERLLSAIEADACSGNVTSSVYKEAAALSEVLQLFWMTQR